MGGCRAASRCGRWSAGSRRSTSRAAAGRAGPPWASCPRRRSAAPGEEALAHVNIPGPWRGPTSRGSRSARVGRFETAADLEGQLVAGTPDDVAAECRKFEALGARSAGVRPRFRFDRWVEQVERLGTDVLPRLGAHLAVGGTHR